MNHVQILPLVHTIDQGQNLAIIRLVVDILIPIHHLLLQQHIQVLPGIIQQFIHLPTTTTHSYPPKHDPPPTRDVPVVRPNVSNCTVNALQLASCARHSYVYVMDARTLPRR